jgi:hypothetical protein
MSNIKLSRISNKSKTSGPTFQGNTSFSGTQSARLPIGDNSERVSVEEGSLRYNDTAGLLEFYDGETWNFIIPAEESANALGVFSGGYNASTGTYVVVDTIDYITISTFGDAKSFGTLSQPRDGLGACSSSTRGIFGGGYTTPSRVNVIDYITIATTGNATDFGDLSSTRYLGAACSSSTRGVFGGGSTPTVVNTIDYITIATTGNAQTFGQLFQAREGASACSSSTRGVFGGGRIYSPTFTVLNIIDYITIASQGTNAADFGDLTNRGNGNQVISAFSSSTRGVWAGGYIPIDYITIASTGNATYFGDLFTGGYHFKGACSSSLRGVVAGATLYAPYNSLNTIQYVTIATTGNASYFGDLTQPSSGLNGGCSNNHGGLL